MTALLRFRALDPSSTTFYSRRSARTEMTCRSACFQRWRDWILILGRRLPINSVVAGYCDTEINLVDCGTT